MWSLWVPLLCMCARTLHGYDFLGQLSHLNRYTQTVSRSSIFFIILIWFDICHTVHYIYVCICSPTHQDLLFFLFYWLDFIASSIIPYTVYIYIYTYYIYIYIHGQSLVISFPPQDDFLAGRMHSVDDKVGLQLGARGPVWRKPPIKNGGLAG